MSQSTKTSRGFYLGVDFGLVSDYTALALLETVEIRMTDKRVKVNLQTGHDSYEAWRERDHDDLVLAVAFASWYALWRKQHEPPIVAPTFGTRKSPWKI